MTYIISTANQMFIDTPHLSAEDWPLVVADRDQLRLENEQLTKALMHLKEENRRLQSSVKSTKKKLSFADSTFGLANLCK